MKTRGRIYQSANLNKVISRQDMFDKLNLQNFQLQGSNTNILSDIRIFTKVLLKCFPKSMPEMSIKKF